MRILIASSSNYIAFHGQAIFTKNLAEGLVRHGHEVLVVSSSENGRTTESEIHGVKVISLKAFSLRLINPNAVLALPARRELRNILSSFKPDIVHVQDHYPLCASMTRLAKQKGIKLIGTNHFMPENLAAYFPIISKIKPVFSWILWAWMKSTYDRLDAVIAPSSKAAEILESRALKAPIFAISCGANTEHFHPDTGVNIKEWRSSYGISTEKKIFFFVGRVDKEKRLDVILRAARSLDRSDIQLVIAGNGAHTSVLKKLAKRLGLREKVVFTGFIPDHDLPSLLNSIDIFFMPSEAELLSIATIQAMACARPILAAKAVALPELVENNVNGFLFHPGDVTNAARCLTELAEHPEQWNRMGAASLQKSQKHNLDGMIIEYEKRYQSIDA
jgi:1,2-diacylglycerol 3-alpha-glucosyltransferase